MAKTLWRKIKLQKRQEIYWHKLLVLSGSREYEANQSIIVSCQVYQHTPLVSFNQKFVSDPKRLSAIMKTQENHRQHERVVPVITADEARSETR